MSNSPIEVYTSFDQIRKTVTDNLLNQLGLSETDLHRGTFVAYLIDITSHMTSNMLFFSSMNYRESFMTLAQLPESVYALSAFLGYKPSIAIPPSVNVLFTIPLKFPTQVTIVLDPGLKLYASHTIYELRNRIDVKIDPENGVYNIVVTDPTIDSTYAIPYSIVNDTISFTAIADQKMTETFDFVTSSDIKIYEFSNYSITFDDQLAGIEVYVDGELWTEFESMYLMRPYDTGYVVRLNQQGATIYFGNGIFGKQLPKNVPLSISITTTKGTDGAIVSKTINACDKVYYKDVDGTKVVKLAVTNINASSTGQDIENINEVRRNSLIHIQSLNRIVSARDYENIGTISKLPIDVSYPILKRSDLKCNEVTVYTIVKYDQEIVPTRTIASDKLDLSKFDYIPYTPITFQAYEYYCPFEITVDLDTKFVYYTYYVRHLQLAFTSHNVNLVDYSLLPTNCDLSTNYNTNTIDFTIDYTISSSDNIDHYKSILTISRNDIKKSYELEVDSYNKVLKTSIDITQIPYSKLEIQLQITDTNTDTVIGTWTSYAIIKQRLDEVIFSSFTWTDEVNRIGIIHEIPVFEKTWYENLDEDQKIQFESLVLQEFIDGLSTNVYRTLNSSLNIKFADTIGNVIIQQQLESESLDSGAPTYTVDTIYAKDPTVVKDVPIGDYFLIPTNPPETYTNEYGHTIPNPFFAHTNDLVQQTNFIPDVNRVLPISQYNVYYLSDNPSLSLNSYYVIDNVPLTTQAVLEEAYAAFQGNNPITVVTEPTNWKDNLSSCSQLWDKNVLGTLCEVKTVDITEGNLYITPVVNTDNELLGVVGIYTPPEFPVAITSETKDITDWINYPVLYCYYSTEDDTTITLDNVIAETEDTIKSIFNGKLYLSPISKIQLPIYKVVPYINDATQCFIAYSNLIPTPPVGSSPGDPFEWQKLGWNTGPIISDSLSLNGKLLNTFNGKDLIYNATLAGTTIRRLFPDGTKSLYFYELKDGNIWQQIYGHIYWIPSFMNLEVPVNTEDENSWLSNGWLEVKDVADGWFLPESQLPNFIYEYVMDKWYIYTKPDIGTTINVKDTSIQLTYNGSEWIVPGVMDIDLPIKIKATVYVDTVSISIDEIKSNIVDILFSYFEPKFDIFAPLYRSDIIRVIQSVPHVVYCDLESPDKDIFFNIDIHKVPASILIDFVPPYIFFKDIELTILPYTAEVRS